LGVLRGKGTLGDAAVHRADKKSTAGHGYPREELDGEAMGETVSFRLAWYDEEMADFLGLKDRMRYIM
jgi:hypothetical protein